MIYIMYIYLINVYYIIEYIYIYIYIYILDLDLYI